MKKWAIIFSNFLIPILILWGCGRPGSVVENPVGFMNVGIDPEYIRPAPEPYGGVIEYSLINFAGKNLGLGLFGFNDILVSGSWVLGVGLLTNPPQTKWDSFSMGVTLAPSENDTCYINTYGGGLTISGEELDIGSSISIVGVENDVKYEIPRNLEDYQTDFGEANYIYYLGLEEYIRFGTSSIIPANFSPGTLFKLSFPGGIAPENANFSFIPRPLSSVGDVYFLTPSNLRGLTIYGKSIENIESKGGVIYSGGDIDITWEPGNIPGQFLTIAIRYLPEDEGEPAEIKYEEGCLEVEACAEGKEYDKNEGKCYSPDGLQTRNLAELVCNASDDGEFLITEDMIEDLDLSASTLNEEVGGAIIFVATTTILDDVQVPPVYYGNGKKAEISPIKVISNNVTLTRLYK